MPNWVKACSIISIALGPGGQVALANSPDLKLLEFLGQWEDSDGQWIDPLVLMEESLEAGDPAESDAPDEGERSGDKP